MFAGMVIFFYLLLIVLPEVFNRVVLEDGIVEWLTFFFLFGTGIYLLIMAFTNQQLNQYKYFIIFFGCFSLLAAMEEISWGQRVFGIENPEFFEKYSDQQEINLHNSFQYFTVLTTKHIAAFVLAFYGIIFPWLVKKFNLKIPGSIFDRVLFPGKYVWVPLIIGAFLVTDIIHSQDEEIAEFMWSISFLVFALHIRKGNIDDSGAIHYAK